MSVVPRQRKNGIVYYVANKWHGSVVFERSGTDKREAARRDSRMKREIAAGTFVPQKTGASTVGSFAREWFGRRKVRTVENEEALYENHVVRRCAWFTKLRLEDVRPSHMIRLVDELAMDYVNARGVPSDLAPKSVALIYGIFKTMFRDARIAELMDSDPCVLPSGKLSRKAKTKRRAYGAADAVHLSTGEEIPWDRRVFNALAFYTGMREGEICGRRWRNLDLNSEPLACLTVDTQYDDRPLKTDDNDTERPRKVPVHPALLSVLKEWRAVGFELVYRRPPREEDFIVPRRDTEGNHTKSSAYKGWRRSCDETGVENATLHSTRHTFITQIRRGGARGEVTEKITHNALGAMIDQYTHWEWAPLCAAMLCLRFDARLDHVLFAAKNELQRLDSNQGEQGIEGAKRRKTKVDRPRGTGPESLGERPLGRGNGRRTNRRTGMRARLRKSVALALKGDRDGEVLVAEHLLRLRRMIRPGASRP